MIYLGTERSVSDFNYTFSYFFNYINFIVYDEDDEICSAFDFDGLYDCDFDKNNLICHNFKYINFRKNINFDDTLKELTNRLFNELIDELS